jgi:hypothetical protein
VRRGFPRPEEDPQYSISLGTRVAVGQRAEIMCGGDTLESVVAQRNMDNFFLEADAIELAELLSGGRQCSLRYQRVGGGNMSTAISPSGFADALDHARHFIQNFRR